MSLNNQTPVITRFAPSPTGSLHLGNARTALFCHLWARKTGGKFILRIEDTDAERSQVRFRDQLMADMRWLGLDWDEGPDVGGPSAPYSQSERGEFYQEMYAQLTSRDLAYPCYCTAEDLELSRKVQRMSGKPPRYAGTCRGLTAAQRTEREGRGLKPTLRFAVPGDLTIEFTDAVHGPQRFSSNDIGDFIIRREDGTPAFFFCNAVDDSAMGVTQVLRGDDHLTNTPRQIMLLEALGMRRPAYGHLGLLVGEDGAPLSKRHGSASAHEFRERGFSASPCATTCFVSVMPAMSTVGCRRPACRRISGRNIWAGRRRASRSRNCCIGRKNPWKGCLLRMSVPGWLRMTRCSSSSWSATTLYCPRTRYRGARWCRVNSRRSAQKSSGSSRRRALIFLPRPPSPMSSPTPT